MPIRIAAAARLLILPMLLGATGSAAAATERTPALIAAVTRAEGGLARAQAIAALEYRLHIKEASYEADATYLVDRGGRMRIDVFIDGKRVVTECRDAHAAWEMDAGGKVTPASAQGASALWRGTQYPGQILSLAELPAHGHAVRAIGSETIDGIAYDVLELTMSDGFTTYRYVDPRSHLITRGRDRRPLHIDIDPTDAFIETAWSDFRTLDGVRRPFVSTQTDLHGGKWLQTTTVESIRKLDRLPDALFVPGAAPQAPL